MYEMLLQFAGPAGLIVGVVVKQWFPQLLPFLFDATKGYKKSEKALDGVADILHNLPHKNKSYVERAEIMGATDTADALKKRLELG